MKKVLKIATTVAALSLFTGIANAAPDNIGYVNMNFLLQNHPLSVNPDPEVVKSLQDEENKLKNEENALAKKIEAFQKEATKLRSADIKKREDALTKEVNEFQAKVNVFEERRSQEQAKITKQVYESISKAVEQVSKAKGYTLVIDSTAILYTQNPSNNLTQDVFQAVGGKLEAPAPQPEKATTK